MQPVENRLGPTVSDFILCCSHQVVLTIKLSGPQATFSVFRAADGPESKIHPSEQVRRY